MGEKAGATGLKNVAGRKKGQATDQELMPGETAEAPSSSRREVCGRPGVHCNLCLGGGFHPSSCTTPAETNHMAGSARGACSTFDVHQRGFSGA